jgi:hypothetical protein
VRVSPEGGSLEAEPKPQLAVELPQLRAGEAPTRSRRFALFIVTIASFCVVERNRALRACLSGERRASFVSWGSAPNPKRTVSALAWYCVDRRGAGAALSRSGRQEKPPPRDAARHLAPVPRPSSDDRCRARDRRLFRSPMPSRTRAETWLRDPEGSHRVSWWGRSTRRRRIVVTDDCSSGQCG